MDLKRLRQRCEARLRDLDLPTPFDIDSFCSVLETRRGRPIRLCPMISRVGPWGLWAAGSDADYIFYEQATSPLHREHIILHETSHLICSHYPIPLSEEEGSRLLFPDLDVETVKRVLGRVAYSGDEEREAELLASLILERAGRGVASRTRMAAPEHAALLDRLGAALEQSSES